ncbi:hypothetical protein [Frigidibacter oleivorans]|uniref:hypothetical protein n=1 Tax=Frigidibacter oleivorans TaxID=2487129 RepID=UPI000F8E9EB7|nr:hypothetical protein [Frigidibacter oleivorans]
MLPHTLQEDTLSNVRRGIMLIALLTLAICESGVTEVDVFHTLSLGANTSPRPIEIDSIKTLLALLTVYLLGRIIFLVPSEVFKQNKEHQDVLAGARSIAAGTEEALAQAAQSSVNISKRLEEFRLDDEHKALTQLCKQALAGLSCETLELLRQPDFETLIVEALTTDAPDADEDGKKMFLRDRERALACLREYNYTLPARLQQTFLSLNHSVEDLAKLDESVQQELSGLIEKTSNLSCLSQEYSNDVQEIIRQFERAIADSRRWVGAERLLFGIATPFAIGGLTLLSILKTWPATTEGLSFDFWELLAVVVFSLLGVSAATRSGLRTVLDRIDRQLSQANQRSRKHARASLRKSRQYER